MKKPNFFLVGFPKCGTTAIAKWLSEHPDVYFAPTKEPHYFASDFQTEAINKIVSEEQYLALFFKAGCERLIGEGSTAYVYSDVAIPKIEQYCKRPKYVVCIRNPVEMAQSEHAQMLKSGHETVKDFRRAWDLSESRMNGKQMPPKICDNILVSYKEFGLQYKYLKRLFSQVESDRIHIIIYDSLTRNPEDVYRKTLEFLGIEFDGRTAYGKENVRRYHKNYLLAKFINEPPNILVDSAALIKRLIGVKRLGFIDWLRERNLREQTIPIDSTLKADMELYFKDDVAALEDLLGISLGWFGERDG